MSYTISQTFNPATRESKNYIQIDDLSIEISKEDYDKIVNKYYQSTKHLIGSEKAKLQIKDNKPSIIEDDGVEQL